MEIRALISGISKKGFFHIFSADILNNLIGFANSLILIHVLSKAIYGEWAYAMNNLSFFLLLSGLGVNNGILYYSALSDTHNEKQSIFKFGLSFGIIFNFIIGILIFLTTYLFTFPIQGSVTILRSLSLLPVLYIVQDSIKAYLRANLRNKEFSYVTSFNSLCLFIFIILGSLYYGVQGAIYAFYLSYFLSVSFGLLLYFRSKKIYKHVYILTHSFKKDFIKYSATCSLTNSISSLLYVLDIFLIGIILKDEAILASYKTATLIPFALSFIPLSIMTFAAPYVIKMSREHDQLKNYSIILKKYLFVINLIISSALFILAPFIIPILFGEEYLDSIVPFRILVFGYLIA